MHVDRIERSIGKLIDEISNAEILLPEIQREYVWKPTQVAKLMDSIYRGYPFGSLLFWETDDAPETRDMSVSGPDPTPSKPPLFLLDGQQRLTSLHRVFTDHPDAQVVFHVENQKFQNQSAATRRDPKWIKVADVLDPKASMLRLTQRLLDAGSALEDHEIEDRLSRIKQLRNRHFVMEVLKGSPYEEVAEIFVRVNSGGRRLGTLDLAMATLSTRWKGVLTRLQDESQHWLAHGYGHIDVNFLSRALAGVVLGRGLSVWSHSKLRQTGDAELERGWEVVKRGLRRLIPLLEHELKLNRSDPLPSMIVLIPLVVLLGERAEDTVDRETSNGIIYWLLLATIRTRYSGSTDTRLSQDIRAARQADPIRALLEGLSVESSRAEVTERALRGRTKESPYFFLSLLVARASGARDWWYGTDILPDTENASKLEHHHVHPPSTLDGPRFDKAMVNDLANLVFISAQASKKINGRSPIEYFPSLSEEELRNHLVPLDETLRTPDGYPRFLDARRQLLAEAMNALLDRFRPVYLDEVPVENADPSAGLSLDLALFGSLRDGGRIVFTASGDGISWAGWANMAELDSAIESARIAGIDSDVTIAGESVPVEMIEDSLQITIGPFLVTGTPEEWRTVFDRELDTSQPLSALPQIESKRWDGEPIKFSVTSTD
ncbi:GmrSD restriction endonuclease domain-containing protein [Micromonospora gifhornensis]|uniref:GmrSD restriction endonuclease domain-containing protein n=1 Tax=Micromonospora gifhornensis TaxID=84594 RepID=UPI0036505C35